MSTKVNDEFLEHLQQRYCDCMVAGDTAGIASLRHHAKNFGYYVNASGLCNEERCTCSEHYQTSQPSPWNDIPSFINP